ncbi:hypothetical protein CSAL01_01941 [Colletotrichum salicis]|uniref:Uncharacterized protein n=1 Tax=Colletotrichum salicis TaxID=1209931 RepID=A0A135TYT2_9PEZI|nr:hypothetical protein CSAL01_01941 [Colletotrichum salicis]
MKWKRIHGIELEGIPLGHQSSQHQHQLPIVFFDERLQDAIGPNNLPPLPHPQPQTTHSPPTLRTAIRNFSSQWFLIPQGTAMAATVLHQLDYRFPGLTIIAYTFWATSILLLLLMLALYAARLTLHPKHTIRALKHNDAELAGLASISITFTSVTQTASLALAPSSPGPWSATVHIL